MLLVTEETILYDILVIMVMVEMFKCTHGMRSLAIVQHLNGNVASDTIVLSLAVLPFTVLVNMPREDWPILFSKLYT